jgi:hypothetical protein
MRCASFFGAIFGYPIGYFVGRKRGLLISSLVFIIGTSIMLGANGSRGLNLIYIGRVIAGLGIGCASNLTPIYISEARNFPSHGTNQIASLCLCIDLTPCYPWPPDWSLRDWMAERWIGRFLVHIFFASPPLAYVSSYPGSTMA